MGKENVFPMIGIEQVLSKSLTAAEYDELFLKAKEGDNEASTKLFMASYGIFAKYSKKQYIPGVDHEDIILEAWIAQMKFYKPGKAKFTSYIPYAVLNAFQKERLKAGMYYADDESKPKYTRKEKSRIQGRIVQEHRKTLVTPVVVSTETPIPGTNEGLTYSDTLRDENDLEEGLERKELIRALLQRPRMVEEFLQWCHEQHPIDEWKTALHHMRQSRGHIRNYERKAQGLV
jgi:hypothetical protein